MTSTLPPSSARGTLYFQERADSIRDGARRMHSEGQLARRTNYGFEKKERELRKQKKNQEKAERRKRGESTSSAPESDKAADETPLDTEAPDRD